MTSLALARGLWDNCPCKKKKKTYLSNGLNGSCTTVYFGSWRTESEWDDWNTVDCVFNSQLIQHSSFKSMSCYFIGILNEISWIKILRYNFALRCKIISVCSWRRKIYLDFIYAAWIFTILFLSSLSPLTSEVVGAPQMTVQQYLSTLPCLPQWISKPHSRPFLDIIFPSLLSFSPSCSFHCPLQNCLRHARGSWEVVITSEFPFLNHG